MTQDKFKQFLDLNYRVVKDDDKDMILLEHLGCCPHLSSNHTEVGCKGLSCHKWQTITVHDVVPGVFHPNGQPMVKAYPTYMCADDAVRLGIDHIGKMVVLMFGAAMPTHGDDKR